MLLFPFAGIAQQLSPEQQEKYEALKVAFLTEELSLSSKEAQAFWPVYNEMDEKLTEIRQAKGRMSEMLERTLRACQTRILRKL